jgi:hypothetical protein
MGAAQPLSYRGASVSDALASGSPPLAEARRAWLFTDFIANGYLWDVGVVMGTFFVALCGV